MTPPLPGRPCRTGGMLALLEDLVDIDSGSEDTDGARRVAERMGRELAGLGFECRALEGARFAPSLYADRGREKGDVLLMGHVDTVFPAGTARRRPFRIDVGSGRAYGPGVLDMKGGLAILIGALQRVSEERDLRGVRVFFNADEEPGSPESRRHLATCAEGARCVLLLEPPDDGEALVVARKGIGVFRLEVRGRAAHAGDAEGAGASAVHAILRAAGRALDLADEAAAVIGVRVGSTSEAERVERAMSGIEGASWGCGTRVGVAGAFHRPPMEPIAGTASVQRILCDAGRSLGVPVRFGDAACGGASDGNLVTAMGIPCIDGLGAVGGGAHTEAEWSDVQSLADRASLLAESVKRLLQERDDGSSEVRGDDGA